jgi:hypothetical protein
MKKSKSTRGRERLPRPDGLERGVAMFVGRDKSRAFGIALARYSDGVVEAYVSDGKGIGNWFTGSMEENTVKATGPREDTLEAVIDRGRAKGKAKVSGKSVSFTLEAAHNASGLTRAVASIKGKELEAAFVVTNDGDIFGTAQSEDQVVYSYSVEPDASTSTDEPIIDHNVPGGPGADPVPMNFVRCSILTLRIVRNGTKWTSGQITYKEYKKKSAELFEDFDRLGCGEWYDTTMS